MFSSKQQYSFKSVPKSPPGIYSSTKQRYLSTEKEAYALATLSPLSF